MSSPLVIPSGFGLLSIHFRCTKSTHECVITHGYIDGAASPVGTNLAALKTSWTNISSRPFEATQMSNKWSIVQWHALQNNGGVFTAADDFTTITGTQSTEFPPMNTALLCKKFTGIAGRKFRGRMFVPPVNITELGMDEAGIWDATALAAVQTKFTNAVGAMVAANVGPYLLHHDATPPTSCSFLLSNKCGTLRTRIR